MNKHEQAAYDLGVEHAKNAASWILDGNATQEHYRRILDGLDDFGSAAYDELPAAPNLSGEWAGDLTPISLYEEITGFDHAEEEATAFLAYETLVGSVVDALADAYERGVEDTFVMECERLLRKATS